MKRLTSALLTTAVIVFAWLLLDRLYGPNEARQRPIQWPPAWQPRDYVHTEVTPVILSEIAPAVVDPSTADPDDLEAVVYVAGNPAMFFQLSAACRSPGVVFQPVADVEGLRPTPGVRTYLVTQTANRAPQPQSAHLVMRQSYMFSPSTMVLLDQVPASRLRTFDPSLNEAVRLYRIVE